MWGSYRAQYNERGEHGGGGHTYKISSCVGHVARANLMHILHSDYMFVVENMCVWGSYCMQHMYTRVHSFAELKSKRIQRNLGMPFMCVAL